MSGYKAGLHKKISTIFDGVPTQNQDEKAGDAGSKLPDFVSETGDKNASVAQNEVKQTDNHQQLNQNGQRLYKDTAGKKYKLNVKGKKDGILPNLIGKLKAKLLPKGANSKRQIASIIAIPVLCIVLVVVYMKVFSSGPKKKGHRVFTPTQTASASDSGEVTWQVPEPLSTDLRDPTKVGSARVQAGSVSGGNRMFINNGEIAVMGIVYSKDKKMAIIGQQIVKEGDQIGDISILKITEHDVEVEANGQKNNLKVGQRWFVSD